MPYTIENTDITGAFGSTISFLFISFQINKATSIRRRIIIESCVND